MNATGHPGRRLIVLAVLSVGALWAGAAASRAEEEAVPSRSSRAAEPAASHAAAGRSTRAPEASGAAKIDAKLDQILANQERILSRLDEVMEELKIVKIRATVR